MDRAGTPQNRVHRSLAPLFWCHRDARLAPLLRLRRRTNPGDVHGDAITAEGRTAVGCGPPPGANERTAVDLQQDFEFSRQRHGRNDVTHCRKRLLVIGIAKAAPQGRRDSKKIHSWADSFDHPDNSVPHCSVYTHGRAASSLRRRGVWSKRG